MKPWKQKANRLVARLCLEAYRQANIKPDGTKRFRHVPYSVPQLAQDLVECLADDDELRAKSLFLSYDGLRAVA